MRLEDFIKDNYEEFNNNEPTDGHFERFETKLRNNRTPKRIHFKPYYWIAASLIGLVIASGFYFSYQKSHSNACILSAEVQNVQNYYSAQMNEEIEKLQIVLDDVNPETREKIMKDVEIMKSDSENLPEIFCDGSNNKKAVAVIVRHYEAKIKAVQSISAFMRENKRITNG